MSLSSDSKRREQAEQDPRALAILHNLGAHFVLLRPGLKSPMWGRSWKRRRPSLDVVQSQRADLGLIPWSVHTTALDVDYGDIGELVTEHPPLTICPAQRGEHLYYRDSEGRGNSNWECYGCGGQVRSANGYLCFHDGGAGNLAHALTMQPRDVGLLPRDLFEAAGMETPTPFEPHNDGGPVTPVKVAIRGPDVNLATVEVGGRRNALFDDVRFWAYKEERGFNLGLWKLKVRRRSLERNAIIRRPLGEHRVYAEVADSIATWVWDGGGPIDHSPPTQSRRGVKSGKVRRLAQVERNGQIWAMRDQGESLGRIAAVLELPKSSVQRVLSNPTTRPTQETMLTTYKGLVIVRRT